MSYNLPDPADETTAGVESDPSSDKTAAEHHLDPETNIDSDGSLRQPQEPGGSATGDSAAGASSEAGTSTSGPEGDVSEENVEQGGGTVD